MLQSQPAWPGIPTSHSGPLCLASPQGRREGQHRPGHAPRRSMSDHRSIWEVPLDRPCLRLQLTTTSGVEIQTECKGPSQYGRVVVRASYSICMWHQSMATCCSGELNPYLICKWGVNPTQNNINRTYVSNGADMSR